MLRVGLQCALPYAHPGHIGVSTLDSSLGTIPALESSLILWKLSCYNFSWIVDNLACLWKTVTTDRSSRCSLYRCMLKTEGIGIILQVQNSCPGMVLNVPPLYCYATPSVCRVIGKVDKKEV